MSTALTTVEISGLEALAFRVRQHVVRMAADGGCFLGASLSCVDLIAYLYEEVLQLTPETVRDPDRDYLFLSKGHDVPALYGTLAELGYLDKARLAAHLKTSDSIYWHPNRAVPGVEFHSGSLGHLLSVAMGVAMDIKLRGGKNRVFVILGDGELDEGSIWEALLVSSALKLDNLVAIVDRNGLQANVRTEELVPLEPLADKIRAFGWQVHTANGHDFGSLARAFDEVEAPRKNPALIIADTVRGKGIPSIEDRADRWFVNLRRDEVESLLVELAGGAARPLTSEPLMVR